MARPPDSLACRLDSSSDRMWALRPKPLPAEFPSQAPSSHPPPHPQCVPPAPAGQGQGQGVQGPREGGSTQSPRPCTLGSPPWLCAHMAPWKSPLGPVLACSPQFFGLRALLRISGFLAPTLGFGHTRHWRWAHGAAHFAHTSLQPARALPPSPHRPGPSPYPAPRLGHGLEQGLSSVSHVCCQQDQTKCAAVGLGARTRSQLPSQKGKGKGLGADGKGIL